MNMVYNIFTRAKKKLQGNNIADKPTTKENPIADDKLPGQQQHPVNSIATSELGNINNNLDVFAQNIQENAEKFNENTISVLDIGNRMINKTSNNEYRVVCKIGYGGFSLVWLVIERKSKEFKVAKVFKYGRCISNLEIETLHQTINHPNILRFYESLSFKSGGRDACVGIYEPLGKDPYTLMKEASKYGGGLPIPVIKKLAKHILKALKTIHGLKVVHSDIKPHNIATCVTQLSLRCQLEKIVKSGKSLSSLRMVCQKNSEFDENKIRKLLEEELEEIPKKKMSKNSTDDLIFKLIDFGNASIEGTERKTGTNGFRPPEYFFGAPLLPSHDIWSLGVTIVVLLTNKMFLEFEMGKFTVIYKDEIVGLRKMFGQFPRRYFKDFKAFKDPDGFKKKFNIHFPERFIKEFTTDEYDSKKAEKQFKKVLQAKFNRLGMLEKDQKYLVDFLFHMLIPIPSKRKSAKDLLSHPWLKKKCTKPNRNRNEKNRNSNASKTQIEKERSVYASGTPVAASSSSSNNWDTSGISLKDLSINEQMKFKNDIQIIPSSFDPKHLTDSSLSDEEDPNKTISEFGSGESYVEGDASFDPHIDSSDDEELNDDEWSDI